MRSLCLLNEVLWLGGLIDGMLAHRIDEHGSVEVSIGDPPEIEGIEELGMFAEVLAYPSL